MGVVANVELVTVTFFSAPLLVWLRVSLVESLPSIGLLPALLSGVLCLGLSMFSFFLEFGSKVLVCRGLLSVDLFMLMRVQGGVLGAVRKQTASDAASPEK